MLEKIKEKLKSLPKPSKPSGFFIIFLINLIVYLFPQEYSDALGVVVNNFIGGGLPSIRDLLSLITYQYAHGGFRHFSGNFMFVAPFALYVESKIGRSNFLKLWTYSGIGSAILFILSEIANPQIQMALILNMPITLIGASGSAFGIAVYALMTYGKLWWEKLLAKTMLLAMIIPQFILGLISMSVPLGVAFWGHIGGALVAILYLTNKQKDCKDKCSQ